MLGLRARQVRTLVATLCVALGALLSVQFAMAALDRIDHDLGVQHAANAVAGPVSYGHAQADHEHADHAEAEHHQIGDQVSATVADSPDPVTHHHHGEGPQLVILLSDATPWLFAARRNGLSPHVTSAPPSASPSGLERPPRSNATRFA